MRSSFTNRTLQTTSNDGRNFHPLEYLYFTDKFGRKYRTATLTDGGSTSWWLWWLIPPFGKKDWFSFILHDGCYRNSIERMNAYGKWEKWIPTERQSNDLLYDALTAQGYGWLKKTGVFIALEWCGWRAFDEDRKALAGPPPAVKVAGYVRGQPPGPIPPPPPPPFPKGVRK